MCMSGAHEDQKRVSALHITKVTKKLLATMWVLGMELRSSSKLTTVPKHKVIFQPIILFFECKLINNR